MKLHWNDAETTGLSPKMHEIVQLSGIIEHDGEIIEEYDIFMRPSRPQVIEAAALEGQGRTLEQLMAFPERKLGFAEFKDLLERYRIKEPHLRHRWAGQNPMFDQGFVRALFAEFHDDHFDAYFAPGMPIDLIPVAKEAKRRGFYKGENNRLGTICRELGIELQAHDSLEDIRATRLAMRKFDELFRTPAHIKRQLPLL
jgi:DNA polymerase-3 subunit epsilon